MNRRIFLAHSIKMPLVAGTGWLLAGCSKEAQQASACVDPSKLTPGERSLRESLRYVDVSNVPAQQCQGCAFFTGGEGGCGHCQMLSGAVSAKGYCTSWSAKT